MARNLAGACGRSNLAMMSLHCTYDHVICSGLAGRAD